MKNKKKEIDSSSREIRLISHIHAIKMLLARMIADIDLIEQDILRDYEKDA